MIGIYRYKIELQYHTDDNRTYIMDSKNIHNLMIDYDYDNKNRPIIYTTIAIDKNVLDDMIQNKESKFMTLIISKYNTIADFKIEEQYIQDEFIYFLSDEMNINKKLDYSGTQKDTEDKFKTVTIGLMNKRLIDDNKVLINDIVKDTSITNIICYHLSHMNLLIEPLHFEKELSRFIIPPLTTISSFIQYIDNYNNLYDSKYRLFFDHDKTYLLSSSGNSIKSKDEDYFSVILNINNTMSGIAKKQGLDIDKFTDSYVLEIDTKDIEIHKDKDTVRSKNTIIGVDNNGNINKVNIGDNKKERIIIDRITNNNLNKINKLKEEIENSTVINIIKTEIDTSILTINKKYLIKSYDDNYSDIDGDYLLSRKREIYTTEGKEFMLTNILSMTKIES